MVTSDRFREVMSNFTTGITVVTTRGKDGQVYGLTVNSFTSVSLDPLLVLVCFDNHLSTLAHFKDSRQFGVSMLSANQEPLSQLFAKKNSVRPAELYFDGPHGLPLLRNCLAYLECETVHIYPGGDHQIYVGKVLTANIGEAQSGLGALLYFRGKYHRL
jgi:3-hydroxy-9,10-secoandrosta-1,3,5(10)-triene-9,17-dione monooxygenase reductase component